jgi:hypothetical protein
LVFDDSKIVGKILTAKFHPRIAEHIRASQRKEPWTLNSTFFSISFPKTRNLHFEPISKMAEEQNGSAGKTSTFPVI